MLQGGYYESTVNYSPSKVETLSSDILSSGYGTDTGGGHTAENLLYLTERFGPIASFSGSYRADGWTINIVRSSGIQRLKAMILIVTHTTLTDFIILLQVVTQHLLLLQVSM